MAPDPKSTRRWTSQGPRRTLTATACPSEITSQPSACGAARRAQTDYDAEIPIRALAWRPSLKPGLAESRSGRSARRRPSYLAGLCEILLLDETVGDVCTGTG